MADLVKACIGIARVAYSVGGLRHEEPKKYRLLGNEGLLAPIDIASVVFDQTRASMGS
jgi:hypothetical protein